jgi:hypothetical protein
MQCTESTNQTKLNIQNSQIPASAVAILGATNALASSGWATMVVEVKGMDQGYG